MTDTEPGSSSEAECSTTDVRDKAAPVGSAYRPETNPFRAVTWRWDRITYLAGKTAAGGMRKTATYDDGLIQAGRKYLAHYTNIMKSIVRDGNPVDVDSAFSVLYAQWPDTAMAHKIYITRGFARWALEALVLADMTADDIAKRLGCPAIVIRTYESMFYDVRDRRGNELFVIDALMTPAMLHGMVGTDYDFFWKGIAYWHGADVLQSMWSMGVIDEKIKGQILECMQSMMDRNTLRATVARQPNQFNAHEFMDEHLQKKQIDTDATKGGSQLDVVTVQGAGVLIEAMQMSTFGSQNIQLNRRESRDVHSLIGVAQRIIEGQAEVTAVLPEHATEIETSVFNRTMTDHSAPTAVSEHVPTTKLVDPETLKDIREKKNLLLERIRSKKVGK